MEKKCFDVHVAERIHVIEGDVNDHDKIRFMKEENRRSWEKIYNSMTKEI